MIIQDQNRHKEKFVFPVFAGLAGLSLLLWMVFLTIYITYITVKTDALIADPASRPLINELNKSLLALAASGSGQASPPATIAPTQPAGRGPTPTTPPAAGLTARPTLIAPPTAPIAAPTLTPAAGQSSSGGSSSSVSSSGSKTNSALPLATKVPLPTPTPIYPRLKFKLRFPDVAKTANIIRWEGSDDNEKIEAVFFRQDKFGRLIWLSETKTSVILRRVENTDYFATDELIVKISTPLLSLKKKPVKEEEKKYAVFIKSSFTLGRLFGGIVIKTGKSAKLLDCAVPTAAMAKDCGELVTMIDQKPLFSGDADGFLDGSPSYNLVDVRDLESFASGKNGDFNLDGRIDELDLGILKKNYGQVGDRL